MSLAVESSAEFSSVIRPGQFFRSGKILRVRDRMAIAVETVDPEWKRQKPVAGG